MTRFLLPSIGVKSYFSEGRFLSITILKIAVIANTAIGSAAKPNRLCGRSKYIFNKRAYKNSNHVWTKS